LTYRYHFHRCLYACLLLALLLAVTPAHAQTPAPPAPSPPEGTAATANDDLSAQVEAVLARMTPADRVGQLFVITFEGNDVGFESAILELIHAYRVGSVVIGPRNLNFSNAKGVDTARQVATLANQLQAIAYGILLPPGNALDPMPIAPWPPRDYDYLSDDTAVDPSNLPLLIGVQQLGDNLPATALRRGFTPLPSQMAIGATWNPELATQVGAVVGRELQAVGVNILLGPDLDVFDQPNSAEAGNLGIYSFGGDPYWVSQLGRAYVTGVHAGGQGQVATVVRHFPGQGNTDRPPDEEVATIQKSLDEMRRIALSPFVAVTRGPSSIVSPDGDPGSTDLMMTSHMRYSAFQGGVAGRITPISLAPELRTILTQEGFDNWHDNGGVLISNALGVPAIRRFYSASAQDFFNRRVAMDAFLAGNDLLFLADFSLDDRSDIQETNIKETIGYFQDRYDAEPDFAGQVDASVRRILRLKLGLYRDALPMPAAIGTPEPTLVEPPLIPLSRVMATTTSLGVLSSTPRAESEAIMGQVARAAITILYPDPATQTDPLPPAFRTDDHILIFSDSRLQRECQSCTAETAIGPDELADIMKRLYGSEATGQIDPALVTSLTFADLTMFLDNPGTPPGEVTPSSLFTPTATPAIVATVTVTSTTLVPDLDGPPVVALVSDRTSKTAALIKEANWIIFAMLNVDPTLYPASDAVGRFLREYDDQLADQKLVVLALNAPYFLDATEMSRLTTYLGVYSKTQPFLESAVRALFRAFTVVGAPPVAVPSTRFSSLPERLTADPARTMPLRVTDGNEQLVAENAAAGDNVDQNPLLDIGATLRLTVGPIIDRNGHRVPDGTLVSFQLQFEGEVLALAVAPAATRAGVATRDVTVEQSGTLRLAATAGQATTGDPLTIAIALPPTPTAAPAALTTVTTPTTPTVEAGGAPSQTPLPERVNLVTLIIALFTILITLSLFLIVQVRVLPRATLVHNMLWAAIFGLAGYILYGFGMFPGANWLRANVSVWGTTVVVFVPMLLPLLWLQLRGEDR